MINLTYFLTRLLKLDEAFQTIYQDLYELMLIEDLPKKINKITLESFDENSYSFIIFTVKFLIKKYNRLLGILSAYDMMPFLDINFKKLNWDDNGSDLNALISNLDKKISELEGNLVQIKIILKLNGVIKEEGK